MLTDLILRVTSVFLRQAGRENRARDGPSVCVRVLGGERESNREQGTGRCAVNPTWLKLGTRAHPRVLAEMWRSDAAVAGLWSSAEPFYRLVRLRLLKFKSQDDSAEWNPGEMVSPRSPTAKKEAEGTWWRQNEKEEDRYELVWRSHCALSFVFCICVFTINMILLVCFYIIRVVFIFQINHSSLSSQLNPSFRPVPSHSAHFILVCLACISVHIQSTNHCCLINIRLHLYTSAHNSDCSSCPSRTVPANQQLHLRLMFLFLVLCPNRYLSWLNFSCVFEFVFTWVRCACKILSESEFLCK